MSDYIPCFGCGARSLNIDGITHAYMLSSPGCWEMFTEVLAREYSDLIYWKGHQYTVDAYACQHVGVKEDKRALNSVNIHLVSLYLMFEMGIELDEAPKLRARFSQHHKGKNTLRWLEPPVSFGTLTIYEIWDNEKPELHYQMAKDWAKSVWEAWSHQHGRVKQLVEEIL